jgi:hypothetical protein
MDERPYRVILDTNLWISYLISNKLIKFDRLLESGLIRLIFSEELLTEFVEVARRPKFRKFFSPEDISTLLDQVSDFGELILVQSEVTICRDPKDNFLLALARDGRADYLITGDHDLLVIGSFEETLILTFSEFERSLA